MTNLKKVLSLALVFVMAFGLMVSASAKTFTDNGDIKNVSAVQLLDSLEIMQGHANGNFEPDGLLTRAQAAKMIYVARTGGKDDKAVVFAGTPNYKDVASSFWGAGYINFAAAKGFVSGRGNGVFDPNGTITGYEFLKILLGSLGYNAQTEGFQNDASWKMNVITAAMEAGLTEGYTGNPNNFITRDEAAGIMANMIYAETVTYKDGAMTEGNSFAVKYLNLTEVKGVYVANEFVTIDSSATAASDGYVRIRTSDTNVESINVEKFGVEIGEQYLGQSITLLTTKNGAGAITKIFGFTTSDQNTVTELTWANMSKINKDNTVGAQYFKNYAEDTTNYNSGTGFDYAYATDAKRVHFWQFDIPKNITPARAIDNNGDGIYDFILENTYTVTTVSSVISGTVSLSGLATKLTSLNAEGLTGLAKNDVVVYRAFGDKYYVEKAQALTAKVDRFTSDATTNTFNIVLDGATYTKAGGVDGIPSNIITGRTVGLQGVYYLFNGTLVYTTNVAATVSNYALMLDSTKVGFEYRVKMLLDTGVTATYTVEAYDSNTTAAYVNDANLLNKADTLFTYTLNSNGTISIAPVVVTPDASATAYTKGDVLLVNNYYVNNATLAFVLDDAGNYHLYKGLNNIPSLTGGTKAYIGGETIASGKYYVNVAFFDGATLSSTSSNSYYYVNSALTVTDAYGNRTFTAVLGDEVVSLRATNAPTIASGNLYNFQFNADGFVTSATPVTTVDAYAIAAENNMIVYGRITAIADGNNTVSVSVINTNKDTVYYNVNGTTVTKGSADSFNLYTEEEMNLDVNHYFTSWVGTNNPSTNPAAMHDIEIIDSDSDGIANVVYIFSAPRV